MSKQRGKGEGSIRPRKDGRWEARITVGLTPKGDPKQWSVYDKTRAEVAKKLTEMLAKQDQGLLTEPNKATVAAYIERSISNRVNVTEGTRYKLRCEVKPILAILGFMRLQDLRTPHVRDAYTALATQGISIRAQLKAASHLRSALRDAVHEGVLVRNVADGVKVSTPRVEEEDKCAQAWTPSEVEIFLEAAKGDPLFPVFYAMLTLGLRRGEALGLPWNAVDLKSGTLRVKQALSPSGNGSKFILKAVKTPSSRRTLYLSHDVRTLLEVHDKRQRAAREFMGPGWQENGLVFTTSLGTAVCPRNALRSFKRIVSKLPVAQIRLHDLRHTYASLALRRGVPIELVSERLGHARVDITLNIYRHLYDAERQAAALSLSDLLGRSGQAQALN